MNARAIAVLSLGSVLLGCASSSRREPDASTDVLRTTVAPNEAIDLSHQTLLQAQELAAPSAQVWNALLAAEEELGMPLESADSITGTVVFHLQTVSPRVAGQSASRFLDCGRGPGGTPRVDTYQLNLRLTAKVERIEAKRSLLRTGLLAYARDRSTTADQLPCTSSGALERRAIAIVAGRLGR